MVDLRQPTCIERDPDINWFISEQGTGIAQYQVGFQTMLLVCRDVLCFIPCDWYCTVPSEFNSHCTKKVQKLQQNLLTLYQENGRRKPRLYQPCC